ncbi:hypothetical protein EIP91_011124 [Steccherinum ochraceum]|uniref:Uncharacterized protein n=1 Tax=Steccherinum ochraceum TaxID=92696 RepID=A0A4R0RUU8_9APHY|nr:hypothetical protein EIP91_011124 [Steccherinum ochraceum]
MDSCSGVSEEPSDLVQKVVQANKDHQYALKVYTERLEAELESVDRLLALADQSDEEPDVDAPGNAVIPESVKALGPFSPDALLEDSPFWEDAERRHKYLRNTIIHPMKAPELDALSESVKAEIHRTQARASQKLSHQPAATEADSDVDWDRVATRVSSCGPGDVQRTAAECKIRWRGSAHPQWNHASWTQQETSRVRELVGNLKEGEVDWVDIANKLGTGRTPVDCMRHAVPRQVHNWTIESDSRLSTAVELYGTANWMLVARMVSDDATASQCQNRYMRTLDPLLKKGAWTEQEDLQLRRAVEVFGHAWSDVCTFVAGRTSDQCRDRWQDFLNPTVTRTKWTEAEDQALYNAIEQVGEGKWKEVSRLMNGRTDSMCRNRYVTLMKRKQKDSSTSLSPTPSDIPTTPSQSSAISPLPLNEDGTASSAAAPIQTALQPKRKARGKSTLRNETTATISDEASASSSAVPSTDPEGHGVLLSAAAPAITEPQPATEPPKKAPGRGRKRAAQPSLEEPLAKKRRAVVKAAQQDTASADPPASQESVPLALDKPAPKRPKPTPRAKAKTKDPPVVESSPASPPGESASQPSVALSGSVPTANDNASLPVESGSSTRRTSAIKSKAGRKSATVATPARKSARLAGKSGAIAPEIEPLLAEPTGSASLPEPEGSHELELGSPLSSPPDSP